MAKRIALIITVRNEQIAISNLLKSIVAQTKQPDEIIITDAQSSDSTKTQIESFLPHLPQIKIIDAGEVNRSVGRNIAIKKAKSDIIIVTDAGCILKKDWIQKITNPILSAEAEVVAGFYLTGDKTLLAKASAPFVATMPSALDPQTYIPSSRSIAFTREAWRVAGKYPSHLDYCEDLVFAQNLKKESKMVVQPRAIVYWYHYTSVWGFIRQIKNYASGDIQAGYMPHIHKILTVYARYILFGLIPLLLIPYIFWVTYKMRKYAKPYILYLYFPAFQFLADFGVMWGSLEGLIVKTFKSK